MSAITPEGQEDFPHDRSTDELINELVTVVNQQSKQIDELQETVKEQSERIDELEQTDKQERQRASKERAELRADVAELEDQIDDRGPHTSDGEETTPDGSVTPETPLEQTVGLPQDLIDEESANVQRAVFVASDIEDYTTSVPAGRAITSSELRRVLKAGTDCNGHSQTVDRVIQVLDGMAQDSVKVVERRGERRVVFDESLCHRLKELSHGDSESNHSVVIGDKV